MMTSLFSIFDPSSSMIFFSNWMIFIFFPLLLSLTNVFSINQFFMMSNMIMKFLYLEAKIVMKKSESLLFLSTFFLILTMNFFGLLPYVMAASSHLSISLFLSLSLWLSIVMWGMIDKFWTIISHMVPYGCPSMLMFFMVLIETVSNLIRPLTLSVRLTANIMAGHVILALVSSSSIFNLLTFSLSASSQFVLLILEAAVAAVQPYVFFTLLTLYKSELNYA